MVFQSDSYDLLRGSASIDRRCKRRFCFNYSSSNDGERVDFLYAASSALFVI